MVKKKKNTDRGAPELDAKLITIHLQTSRTKQRFI